MKRQLRHLTLWSLLVIGTGTVALLRIALRALRRLGVRGLLAVVTGAVLWNTGLLTPVRPILDAVRFLGPVLAPWMVVAVATTVLTTGLRSSAGRRARRRLRARG